MVTLCRGVMIAAVALGSGVAARADRVDPAALRTIMEYVADQIFSMSERAVKVVDAGCDPGPIDEGALAALGLLHTMAKDVREVTRLIADGQPTAAFVVERLGMRPWTRLAISVRGLTYQARLVEKWLASSYLLGPLHLEMREGPLTALEDLNHRLRALEPPD